eukprot:NODE_141_length_2523_cov_63.284224_g137_i0.p1 GENE.NODE_141_length_2523_cov_63.284224_g137_i0~~NODE_141_length_2523_cov_63.284224_g137_i0.p1  ORF type:complete len:834 (+),score=132.56 NODE_141_length_2523_cov_63.284224_g137_i0:172-2502(+)
MTSDSVLPSKCTPLMLPLRLEVAPGMYLYGTGAKIVDPYKAPVAACSASFRLDSNESVTPNTKPQLPVVAPLVSRSVSWVRGQAVKKHLAQFGTLRPHSDCFLAVINDDEVMGQRITVQQWYPDLLYECEGWPQGWALLDDIAPAYRTELKDHNLPVHLGCAACAQPSGSCASGTEVVGEGDPQTKTLRKVGYRYLEYCSGRPVSDVIAEFGQLSEGTCRKIVQQVLVALVYLHSKGIRHCAVTTQTIWVDNSSNATLVGLWAAQSTERMHHGKSGKFLFGGPSTMHFTPGQRNRNPVSTVKDHFPGLNVDLWQLALALYEMRTGKPVWASSPDFLQVAYQINWRELDQTKENEFYHMLCEAAPSIPPCQHLSALGNMFLTMCCKRHPPSAETVLNDSPWFHTKLSADCSWLSGQESVESALQQIRAGYPKVNCDGILQRVDCACTFGVYRVRDRPCDKCVVAALKRICLEVRHSRTLSNLGLSNNPIGLAGAKIIADLIKVNTSLDWLGLHGTSMPVAGWDEIADALEYRRDRHGHRWSKLRLMNLKGNELRQRTLDRIEASLGLAKVAYQGGVGYAVWRKQGGPVRRLQRRHFVCLGCFASKSAVVKLKRAEELAEEAAQAARAPQRKGRKGKSNKAGTPERASFDDARREDSARTSSEICDVKEWCFTPVYIARDDKPCTACSPGKGEYPAKPTWHVKCLPSCCMCARYHQDLPNRVPTTPAEAATWFNVVVWRRWVPRLRQWQQLPFVIRAMAVYSTMYIVRAWLVHHAAIS